MANVNVGEPRAVSFSAMVYLGVSSLATAAFLTLTLTEERWLGYAFCVPVVVYLIKALVQRKFGGDISVHLLLLGGFLADHSRRMHAGIEHDIMILGGASLIALLLNQALIKKLTRRGTVQVAHLPGARFTPAHTVTPRTIFAVQSVLVLLTGITSATGLTAWPAAALSIGLDGLAFVVLLQTRHADRRARTAPAIISKALEHYSPEFAVYFSAPKGSEYQLLMWLPYLDRLGRKYVIIMREDAMFPIIADASKYAPVVVAKSIAALDSLVVPSLKATLYVNNGMKNMQMLRFNDLTHVQMLHGDSDKASSYNPVTAIFDKIFVGGQVGIDRYAKNNVFIDAEKFVIVGRPQVDGVKVASYPIREVPNKTVLYTPTWAGYFNDANYSSLGEHGVTIVRELLNRGATVIARMHPYTRRTPELAAAADEIARILAEDTVKTGRKHLFGDAAEKNLTPQECFNLADAMVSDVSAIASDFLYSEKPLAMVDMVGDGPMFGENFPLAKSSYVIAQDGSNIGEALGNLLGPDPLEVARREAKVYFLGPFPDDAYVEGFLQAVRDVLDPVNADAHLVEQQQAVRDVLDPVNANAHIVEQRAVSERV